MRASCGNIPGIIVLEPRVFVDERGFFFESYNKNTLAALGIDVSFVQDNHSLSRRGTLRGIHYQVRNPQAKLVRVVSGEVFDVAVDLRRSSPTFGRWFGLNPFGCKQAANLYSSRFWPWFSGSFGHGRNAL